MSYPSEYVAPLPRATFVQTVVTSGYVTSRLVSQDPVFVADGTPHQLTVQNTGASAFSFKVLQTNDPSATGTRTDASSTISLVAGGEKVVNLTPTKKILEIYGTSGTGNLRMNIVSKTRYQEMAFDKSDTFFPQIITQARPTPTAPYI